VTNEPKKMKLGMFNDSDESSEDDFAFQTKKPSKTGVPADILKDEDIFAKMSGTNDEKMTKLAQKQLQKIDLWKDKAFKNTFEKFKDGNGGIYGLVKGFDESLIAETDEPKADSEGVVDCMQQDF
jgi:hypothetical protein